MTSPNGAGCQRRSSRTDVHRSTVLSLLMTTPAFVPSPRWLTESPARPPSSGGTSISTPRRRARHEPVDREQLRSPIPPPPENLYREPAQTFNVDPGEPFLAAAGAGGSERGSEDSGNRFVGGFVTGVRKVVRQSLRDRTGKRRLQKHREEPPSAPLESSDDVRDSGYASSGPAQDPTVDNRRPSAAEPHRQYYSSPRPDPVNAKDYGRYYEQYDESPLARQQGLIPLTPSIGSPVSANVEYGSDYAKMDLPAKSDVSFNTLVRRVKHFAKDVAALPLYSKGRVTYDYYPEVERRDDPRRRPAVVWHSHNYTARNNFHLSFHPSTHHGSDVDSYLGSVSTDSAIQAPRKMAASALDLDEEFVPTPHSTFANRQTPRPTPYQTPQRDLPPGLGDETPIRSSSLTPVPFVAGDGPQYGIGPSPAHSFQWQTAAQYPDADPSWAEAIAHAQDQAYPPGDDGYWEENPQTPYSYRQANVDDGPLPQPVNDDQWQEYPRYMSGYVPPEYAEPHYGAQYGEGIHTARSGTFLGPFASEPPSTASTRNHPYQ